MLTVDPLPSVAPAAIVVELCNQEFVIPATPAAGWFAAILGNEPLPIVPGMLGHDDAVRVWDLIAIGVLDVPELVEVSREVLEAASGWRWWIADRMIRSAGAQWVYVGGVLATSGVDLSRVSLGTVLASIWALATANLEASKRSEFEADLTRPPTGVSSAEFERIAADMFTAALAERAAQ